MVRNPRHGASRRHCPMPGPAEHTGCAPEEEAERVIPLIREEMENAVKLRIPLKVSIEKGKRWGEFH